jgi:Zn-dependent protease
MKQEELQDLTISAILLALAFGIALSGGISVISRPGELGYAFSLSLVGVSSGFIIHELGHRYLARRFNCFARYVMWPSGLVLALILSLFGFVFAAPGAVMIRPGTDVSGKATLTKKRFGLISIAGPVMNVCLSVVFILLYAVYPATVFSLGAQVNTWLALFNLIPIGPLDGGKILSWDKRIWLAALVIVGGMFVAEFFIF